MSRSGSFDTLPFPFYFLRFLELDDVESKDRLGVSLMSYPLLLLNASQQCKSTDDNYRIYQ
jgi:hypothetical protein